MMMYLQALTLLSVLGASSAANSGEMCSFCPDGFTITEETAIDACEAFKGNAAIFQAGDAPCDALQLSENMCCGASSLLGTGGPEPQDDMGEMCSFCPNGFTMPEDAAVPTTIDACEAFKGTAAIYQAGNALCDAVQLSEDLCCGASMYTVGTLMSLTVSLLAMIFL